MTLTETRDMLVEKLNELERGRSILESMLRQSTNKEETNVLLCLLAQNKHKYEEYQQMYYDFAIMAKSEKVES